MNQVGFSLTNESESIMKLFNKIKTKIRYIFHRLWMKSMSHDMAYRLAYSYITDIYHNDSEWYMLSQTSSSGLRRTHHSNYQLETMVKCNVLTKDEIEGIFKNVYDMDGEAFEEGFFETSMELQAHDNVDMYNIDTWTILTESEIKEHLLYSIKYIGNQKDKALERVAWISSDLDKLEANLKKVGK